mmetsp:Transcript_1401/g.2103  ORF Transcript_1401/g.2103 Transcript_1401/m.2103 type:complete len:574 (+) Transcript_1401:591-2312(+)
MVLVHGPLPRLHILVRISRTERHKSRNAPQHGKVLNGLMSRSILTHANGIVGEDPARGDFHESRQADHGLHVVREDEEARAKRADLAQGHTVHDRSHGVLADSKVEVTTGVRSPSRLGRHEVTIRGILEAGLSGRRQIGRTSKEVRTRLGDRLHDLSVRNTTGHALLVRRVRGQLRLPSHGHLAILHEAQLLRKIWELALVLIEHDLPLLGPLGTVRLHLVAEVIVHAIGHVERLVRRKAVELLRRLDLLLTNGGTVRAVGVLLVWRSPGNVRIDDDERRAILLVLGRLERVTKTIEIVGIRHTNGVPSVRDETSGHVLGKGPVSVTLDGDLVVIVHPDEVVKLEMTCKGGSLRCNTLLHAAITAHGVRIEVEELVSRLVVRSSKPLTGNGHSHTRGQSITERSSGGLNSRSPAVLGMTGTAGMELAEGFEIVHAHGLAVAHLVVGRDGFDSRQVHGGVEKHGGMAETQDETITVGPDRIRRVEAEELGPDGIGDRRHGHWCSRMSAVRLLDSIHGKTTNRIHSRRLHLLEIVIDNVATLLLGERGGDAFGNEGGRGSHVFVGAFSSFRTWHG